MPHMLPYPSVEQQLSRQRKRRVVRYICWFTAVFVNLIFAVAYFQNVV